MVFSNAQTVVMNNQEVDSIILSDGGVLYEAKNISLMLSYSPSTVYYGDTVTLTATLTKKNIGLANKTISFYTESESFIPTTETYSGITYNCYEVNGEGNISFNGNSCIILQNNEIKTQADIYNGKHLIEIKDSKLYIDGDEITTDIDPSKNYKIGIITTATDVTHHFGRLLGSSSTDSNGVASATVVCTGFSSLTATISYKDVSDSANIIVNDKYDLTIESDKDILSYNDNDTATLTATLTKNGVPVEGETIQFISTNVYEKEIHDSGNYSEIGRYFEVDLSTLPVNQYYYIGGDDIISSPISITKYSDGTAVLVDRYSDGMVLNDIVYFEDTQLKYVDSRTGNEIIKDISNYDLSKWNKFSVALSADVLVKYPVFYKSGATDANGQCSVTYDSKGIGDIHIKAKCVERMLLIES